MKHNFILPYGYTLEGYTIVVDELEYKIIEEIFILASEGYTLGTIAKQLNHKKLTDFKWHPMQLWRIVNSEFYYNETLPKIVSFELYSSAKLMLDVKRTK